MDQSAKELFSDTLWNYYAASARDLPWRQGTDGTYDPYRIVVSELMLQQTQVSRVIPKFNEFIEQFPNFRVLAEADIGEVLRLWSGLGYNRRAKYLWQAAAIITQRYDSIVPDDEHQLVALPGIGRNTAGAIRAYAFNKPAVFIETNIRTVLFHHFFKGETEISDTQLFAIVEELVDRENPREWYWAMMDYGSHLKRWHGGLIDSSKHYKPQTAFQGSTRQLRGRILRLLKDSPMGTGDMAAVITDERLDDVLDALLTEGLIRLKGKTYSL